MNSTAPASRPVTAQVVGRMCLEVGLSIVAYQIVVYQKEEYRHCAGHWEATKSGPRERKMRSLRSRDLRVWERTAAAQKLFCCFCLERVRE